MAQVELQQSGDVTEIVLNRPDKLNAIDFDTAALLASAVRTAASGPSRAVVLRGEGRGFSAGRDIAGVDPREEDAGEVLEEIFNPIIASIAALPMPTFAAVQGGCLGVGFGLAMACDVVYAANDAKLGSPFARLGAVPDSGAHAVLLARVGRHRALELIYTGRLISGAEAASMGLVNAAFEADELLDRTRRTAAAVAAGPTAAFGFSKRLLDRVVDEGLGLSEVLAAEAAGQRELSATDDYREGFAAFQEKRKPTFHGR